MMRLPDITRFDTLPKLLGHNAAAHGGDVALREKEYGIWRLFTWANYQAAVRDRALGLQALGVGHRSVVGLIGDNRPDWIFGEVAAHVCRAMSLGIYRDALEPEAAYLIDYAQCAVVIAEDEEQVDKLLGLGDGIPSVRHIVYCDPRGLRKYDDPRLMPMADLVERGRALDAEKPALYDELVAAGSADDVAVLCTTSGTTSHPKLAMLQHGAILRHVVGYLGMDPKDSSDEYVSILPLPWIMEQTYCIGKSMVCRMKINFVEEPDTAMQDLREIGPTFLLYAPRVWESIAADVRARMMESSWLKRTLFELGMKHGLQALGKGRRSRLAQLILFRALKDRLGLSRVRSAATGGAALGPETYKFFLAMGVPLRQLYGQTETLGAYTLHRPDEIDLETVGTVFPAVEVRIENPDPEGIGEIVTRHPNMMLGYYGNEKATKESLVDGWMRTGDAGYFDGKGHLIVIDRVGDLATTARGIRFSPQYIENKLKFSSYIAEAVILGAGRHYLAAMVCIRFPIVSRWAERRRIAFTTYTDLSARAEVANLVREEVERVNGTLPDAQRIRKFILLYKELDADDGELTRTRKVRRGVVGQKYAGIVDALYSEADTVDIDTTISFQDGSSQRIVTKLRVTDLGGADIPNLAAAEQGPFQ